MSLSNITQSIGAISGQTAYDPLKRLNTTVSPATAETPAKTGAENASNDTTQANKKKPGEESLADAVKKANQTIQLLRSNLQFSVDEETGIDVVKFIDTQTKEVIRQIPSEEMLSIAHRLDELTGMLIRDKA